MEEGLKEKDFPNLQQDHLSSIPPASLRGIVFQDFLAGDFPSPPLSLDAAARSPPDPVPFLPCKRSTKLSPAACRQKRMLKNRESAARSRARKQAYTTELEIEVAQLTDENARLKRQQEELKMAMASQAVAAPSTGPLQRTSTAPSTGPLQRTSTAPF